MDHEFSRVVALLTTMDNLEGLGKQQPDVCMYWTVAFHRVTLIVTKSPWRV